jgi:hypothetical protein
MSDKKITNAEEGTQKSTKRSAIGSGNEQILKFLRSCTAYQADAIRVMVDIASNDGVVTSVNASELILVQRYLNQECYKEDGNDYARLLTHRQARAQLLLKSVAPFLEKEKLLSATIALMEISADRAAIEQARQSLPSRPAGQATFGAHP